VTLINLFLFANALGTIVSNVSAIKIVFQKYTEINKETCFQGASK
jgi:hypothetical protein